MGQLEAIWIKRVRRGPMDPVTEAVLEEGRGIVGNANQGGRRQVTLLERENWERFMDQLHGDIDPSARRANFLVSGVALRETRERILLIGDCRIQIWGATRPCERMDEALQGLRDAMRPDWGGGAFGTVLVGGRVRVGDSVNWAD